MYVGVQEDSGIMTMPFASIMMACLFECSTKNVSARPVYKLTMGSQSSVSFEEARILLTTV